MGGNGRRALNGVAGLGEGTLALVVWGSTRAKSDLIIMWNSGDGWTTGEGPYKDTGSMHGHMT